MNIKKGDMVSIKQDFIDQDNEYKYDYKYDSRDIWEVKEVYKIGGGYHVAAINNGNYIPVYTTPYQQP